MEDLNILIVDDDQEIRDLVVERLAGHGFSATAAENGTEMFARLTEKKYDLLLLDVMMPGENGLELCRRLRQPGSDYERLPIIFLSALDETADRVVGLEIGGDDYLPKPFQSRELVARIRAVLRRSDSYAQAEPEPFHNGGEADGSDQREALWHFDQWRLNPLARHLIDADDLVVPLSAAEFRLLMLFLNNPGRILNRDQIMEYLAGRSAEAFDRSVDVQVSRLRGKLRDNGKNARIIRTMRGDGYMLAVPITRKGSS